MGSREFLFGPDCAEWLVRLHWESDDKVYWVGFKLFRNRVLNLPRLYGDGFEENPGDDEADVSGSVKWDGCTNFDGGEAAMHACDEDDLRRMFDVISKARRVALIEIMARPDNV